MNLGVSKTVRLPKAIEREVVAPPPIIQTHHRYRLRFDAIFSFNHPSIAQFY